jgi:hypothetical protein
MAAARTNLPPKHDRLGFKPQAAHKTGSRLKRLLRRARAPSARFPPGPAAVGFEPMAAARTNLPPKHDRLGFKPQAAHKTGSRLKRLLRRARAPSVRFPPGPAAVGFEPMAASAIGLDIES